MRSVSRILRAQHDTQSTFPSGGTVASPSDVFALNSEHHKTVVMGVINVTPDSFYDGGTCVTDEGALRSARAMISDGADVIDVGGESSRPGAEAVGLDEELRRILSVVEGVASLDIPVSVDTYRAEAARRALEVGASMINDIYAFRKEPEMAAVVGEAGCSCVLMHMQGEPHSMQESPRYDNILDEVASFFEERIAFAVGEGVEESRIWLDPGFGFGKTVAHNLTLLKHLETFKRFGRPLLVGTSNKSTIGKVLDLPLNERLEGTAATVAVAIMNGADGVRVHDVGAMVRVARMTDAILNGK